MKESVFTIEAKQGNLGPAVNHWSTKQALEVSFTKINDNWIKQFNIATILLAGEWNNLLKWGRHSIMKHESDELALELEDGG